MPLLDEGTAATPEDTCDNVTIDIQVGGGTAANFNTFLVGGAQPAINVQINTTPAGKPVEWTINPVGDGSGIVTPDTGMTNAFSFSPTFSGTKIRPTA